MCKCISRIFCESEPYLYVVSDRHSVFKNRLWEETLHSFGSKAVFTTRIRPQANRAEVFCKRVKKCLAMYIKSHKDWGSALILIEYSLNQQVSETTSFPASHLHFGRRMRTILDNPVISNLDGVEAETYPEYVYKNSLIMKQAMETANKCQQDKRLKYEHYYNRFRKPHSFIVGDKVLLRNKQISSAAKQFVAKLAPIWIGPFVIVEQLSRNNFTIRELNGTKVLKSNSDQLKRYYDPLLFKANVKLKHFHEGKTAKPTSLKARRRYNFRQPKP